MEANNDTMNGKTALKLMQAWDKLDELDAVMEYEYDEGILMIALDMDAWEHGGGYTSDVHAILKDTHKKVGTINDRDKIQEIGAREGCRRIMVYK